MEPTSITGGLKMNQLPLKRFNQPQGQTETVIHQEQTTNPSLQQVETIVSGANHFFKSTNTHVQFHIHEKLNAFYVEIRNSENNEVIKELPPKKFLDMMAKLQELAGIIIDEKV